MAVTEARKLYLAGWREKNREKLKEQALSCYYRHHEKRKLKSRVRAAARRRKAGQLTRMQYFIVSGRFLTPSQRASRKRANSKRFRQRHPDKAKLLDFRNNSRRRRLSKLSNEVVRAKLAYYGNRCYYCGSEEDITIDHKKPIVRGGLHLPANLVPACGTCNSKKNKSWKGPQFWLRCRDYWNPQAGMIQNSARPRLP